MPRHDIDSLFATLEDVFGRSILGIDPMFRDFERYVNQRANNYPPYNVITLTKDRHVVEVACAGFSSDELEVEADSKELRIRGTNAMEKYDQEGTTYLHRGIASRDFTLTFRLGEHMVVGEPLLKDGLLMVPVTREVPEALKSRKIPVLDYHQDTEPVEDKLENS